MLHQNDGDHMTIHFADGTTAYADFVIAADGIHSAVRSRTIATEHAYSGVVVYRGLIDTSLIKDWWPLEAYSASFIGKNKHFVTMPIGNGNKLLNYGALVVKPNANAKESWTATGTKAEIAEDFAEFNDIVRKVIEVGPEAPGKWLLNDREPLEQWVFDDGKVVLLGDAAHAMLPHEGP